MDPQNTQSERTILSWQRTFFSMITVAGIGTLQLLVTGEMFFIVAALVVSVIAAVPMVARQRQLHRGHMPPLTWQPKVLTACAIVLAIAAIVSL